MGLPDIPVIGGTNANSNTISNSNPASSAMPFSVPEIKPTPVPGASDIRLVGENTPPVINVPALPGGTSGGNGGGIGSGAVIPAPVVPVSPPSGGSSGGIGLPDINVPTITPTPAAPPTPTPTPTPAPTPVPRVDLTPGGSIGGGIVPEQPRPNPVITPTPAPSVPAPSLSYTPPPAPSVGVIPTATAPRAAESSFDVDVHTVRQGDTYAAISRKYYGEDTFAQALEAYDRSRANRMDGQVHVPPVWVLRKRFMNTGGGLAEPIRRAETVPAERNVNTTGGGWQPGTGRGKVYTAPRTMTMREIAKLAYGDENKWTAVWDLNLNLSTDSIPAGAKVNLPADAAIGQ
jgi:nucleoid-associated protein YgaU